MVAGMSVALVGLPVIAKPSEPSSRYAKVGQCREIDSGDVDAGEDWIYVRCGGLGGISMWYVCQDSARCRYGFGRKANLSSGMFGVDGDPGWPIEWRGRMIGKRFKPFAVIMRGRGYGIEKEEGSSLTVFRLRPDGMSCVVGEEVKSNEAARKIADAVESRFTCTGEPNIPPWSQSNSPIW
jgi:hypothetical protein